MKELRHPDDTTAKKGRKRKVTTAPGLSISAADLTQPSVSQPKKPRQTKKTEIVERSQKPANCIQKKKSKQNPNVATDCVTSDESDNDESLNRESDSHADCKIGDKSSNKSKSVKRERDTSKKPFIRSQQKNTVKPVPQKKVQPKKIGISVDTSKKPIASPVIKPGIATKKSINRDCDSLKKPVERPRRCKPVKRL